MSYEVRLTADALEDLTRLYRFLAERDVEAARRAIEAVRAGFSMLETFPFSCRKATDDPLLREILIPFGSGGYVALYEIEEGERVAVLAVRHQFEDDYY